MVARAPEPQLIELVPYSPTIGCEIRGVDLSMPLTAENKHQIYQALLDWKVIFFRNQNITTEQHLAFAREFGKLEVHPFAPHKPDYPEVLAITHDGDAPGRENLWHSDVTWREKPSLGSVLRCLECPDVGGDTLFADMYAAYEGLPIWVQEAVEGRTALHNFEQFRRGLLRKGATETELQEFDHLYPNPEHPVIRTHPDTGRKAIYVNGGFTDHIVGMERARSDELLALLYAQATIPEYQCRFRWEPNSIAFWDNRACQHYAASDYWPSRRIVERVTVVGDRPFYTPSPIQNPQEREQSLATSSFRGRLQRMAKAPPPA